MNALVTPPTILKETCFDRNDADNRGGVHVTYQ